MVDIADSIAVFHVTATCQLQELSLKAERNTYIWPFAVRQIADKCGASTTALGESRRSHLANGKIAAGQPFGERRLTFQNDQESPRGGIY